MIRILRSAALPAALLSILSLPHRAKAQDIVKAGQRHGVPLPEAGRRILAKDPTAFQFRRGLKSKLRAAQIARGTSIGLLPSYGPTGSTSRGGGPLRGARIGEGPVVNGTARFPVLPILFANTANQPWATSDLQRRLFDGPNSPETLTQLYTAMSHGNLTVTGTVYPWTSVPGKDTTYEGVAGSNGLDGAGLYKLLKATLDVADQTIDFRQYDSDGDHYVDLVAFVQPESGGECGPASSNNNMWSHRWVYQGAASQAGITGTAATDGYLTNDGVYISDYILQPALDCNKATPIQIGVFAHEFGHTLGLPDLYATGDNATNEGIGNWSLMAAGEWNQPESPASMDAWSLMQLGWETVTTISHDSTHVVLNPVETTGGVIRLNIPGTSEYFLLENRQRIGTDLSLPGTGLLILHVDSQTVADNWDANTIENATSHKGLDVVEADGLAGLDRLGYRGGAGDTFPGTAHVTSWTAETSPTSSGYGQASGISITNIVESGGVITFDLTIGAVGAIAVKWGDVDGDGVVGHADLNALYGCLLTSSCNTVSGINRADVDGDLKITLRDGLIIHSYVVGGVDVARFRVGQVVTGTAPAVTFPAGGTPQTTPPAVLKSEGTP
jgi:M6 family metalloprotease-like protein